MPGNRKKKYIIVYSEDAKNQEHIKRSVKCLECGKKFDIQGDYYGDIRNARYYLEQHYRKEHPDKCTKCELCNDHLYVTHNDVNNHICLYDSNRLVVDDYTRKKRKIYPSELEKCIKEYEDLKMRDKDTANAMMLRAFMKEHGRG